MYPRFSRKSDFSRTIKQGAAKKEFRERQRRERRKFDELCEDFLRNRPKNSARFLNLLKMSKFCHPPHFTKQASKCRRRASHVVGTSLKTAASPKWGGFIKPCSAIQALFPWIVCCFFQEEKPRVAVLRNSRKIRASAHEEMIF